MLVLLGLPTISKIPTRTVGTLKEQNRKKVTYLACCLYFCSETSELTYPHPAMIINPIGIFTVSLFLNRNKEKDRKPRGKKKAFLLLLKKEPIIREAKHFMM